MERKPACLSGLWNTGSRNLCNLWIPMKKLFLLPLLFAAPLFGQTAVSVLVKEHDNRADTFEDRPYGKDDISYGLFVEAFEGVGGWRFGAMYSGDLSGAPGADSVITPEIALLVVDRIWETGFSVLIDYVDVDGDTDWGDVYFQTQLGLNLPLGNSVQAGIHAFYPFSSISDITDFGFDDLDYGIQIRVMF